MLGLCFWKCKCLYPEQNEPCWVSFSGKVSVSKKGVGTQKSGRVSSSFGQKWKIFFQFWPKVEDFLPVLAKSGRVSSSFGQKWKIFFQFWPKVEENLPVLAKSGRFSSSFVWPILGKKWTISSTSGLIWKIFFPLFVLPLMGKYSHVVRLFVARRGWILMTEAMQNYEDCCCLLLFEPIMFMMVL